jgi:hypothetical protein
MASTEPDLPAASPEPSSPADATDADAEPPERHHQGILDRLRHSGAGTTDPNIVGDAGPFDQPPGIDPELAEGVGPAGLPLLPPEEEGTAQV